MVTNKATGSVLVQKTKHKYENDAAFRQRFLKRLRAVLADFKKVLRNRNKEFNKWTKRHSIEKHDKEALQVRLSQLHRLKIMSTVDRYKDNELMQDALSRSSNEDEFLKLMHKMAPVVSGLLESKAEQLRFYAMHTINTMYKRKKKSEAVVSRVLRHIQNSKRKMHSSIMRTNNPLVMQYCSAALEGMTALSSQLMGATNLTDVANIYAQCRLYMYQYRLLGTFFNKLMLNS